MWSSLEELGAFRLCGLSGTDRATDHIKQIAGCDSAIAPCLLSNIITRPKRENISIHTLEKVISHRAAIIAWLIISYAMLTTFAGAENISAGHAGRS
jgi:hypothetical protein